MTPARWEDVKELFARAMELPAEDRPAFVERESRGDDELCREVASLLDSAAGSDSLPAARAAIAAVGARAFGRPNPGAAHDGAFQPLLETALGHQYEIVRPLGQGGMGAVYLARERALERFVAIKVLRPDLAGAQQGRERFRREARVVAGLSHPGILPLHTFGEVGGTWYFVMGYVRGASLADRLRVEGRLPSGDAQRILIELADALECAHRHGVVHRDIKPGNVLLDEDGRAVLADFGIAKVQGAADSLTATGMVVGTPHFMSPEQAAGSHDVDERSDVYSLGAVGYTMLAGREPFGGLRADELMRRRATEDPVPLQAAAPGVSAEVATVLMRCLARDPALRWPSARAFRDALMRAAGVDDGALPDSLRDLPTFGPYALLWAGIWTAFAIRPFRSVGDRALLLLIALVVPLGLVLHLWNVGDGSMRFGELARVAFWPPEWWGMWWPRRLRRPTDLWRRLPWPARAVRGVLSAFLVALPGMILLREWVEAIAGAGTGADDGWFVVAEAAVIGTAAVVVGAAVAWAWRARLSRSEAARMLFGATAPSRAWMAPSLSRLLAPPRGGVREPERDVPADYLRALTELAARLPMHASELGRDAVHAAAQLRTAIERRDAEAAVLAHDASATELDRLTARADGLAAEGGGGAEHRELAELVQRQLDVVRRMRVRADLLAQQRGHALGLLRGLWTQLGALEDASGTTPVPEALRDRVRALCRDADTVGQDPGGGPPARAS